MELTMNKLTKQYKNIIAVDQVSITLNEGVYGLLGANGAGKTTLMRMLCDIQKPTSGEVLCNRAPISEMGESYRNLLGYLPQSFGYYPDFTAYHFMMYLAGLKGLYHSAAKLRVLELLETVRLLNERNRKIKHFSGGMKQRLGIAQALLNHPRILILDEPTAGLDPKERVFFRNLISSLSKNKIILLSTHIVSDIEYIADRVLVMKKGELIHSGKPEDILKSIRGLVWDCEVPNDKVDAYSQKHIVSNLKNSGEYTVLRIVSGEKPCDNAVRAEPTLEDLYLYYFEKETEGL